MNKPDYSEYAIRLYLDQKYWSSEKISRLFGRMDKKLDESYMGRDYHVQAFCYDSPGNTKEKRY